MLKFCMATWAEDHRLSPQVTTYIWSRPAMMQGLINGLLSNTKLTNSDWPNKFVIPNRYGINAKTLSMLSTCKCVDNMRQLHLYSQIILDVASLVDICGLTMLMQNMF